MKKIKKLQDGIWKTDNSTKPFYVDIRPAGKYGNRKRAEFTTRNEAIRYKDHWSRELKNSKTWEPEPEDNRRLADLIDIWHKLHGKSLNDITKRLAKMNNMCNQMENPIARKITASDWAKYRATRLEKVSIKTVNNEQTYLNAMFNELIRLEEIKENPITNVRSLKYKQPEMGFLTTDEIPALLDELKKSRNPDTYFVAKIALSTGARWSEAESLTSRQIANNQITYINTKGGKNRTIPISSELAEELPMKTGKLFTSCISAFRVALKRTEIELPKGQATHVLRHTFASSFMIKGGNILVLQQILGHSNITDTMRYAHFSKTHLEDAIRLNPLNDIV